MPARTERGVAYLTPEQNFVNQAVFDPLYDLVPEGFFKDPDDIKGFAVFVRTVFRFSHEDLDLACYVNSWELNELRPYAHGVTNLRKILPSIAKYKKENPHLKEYVWEYLLKRRSSGAPIANNGESVNGVSEEVPTYEVFLRQYQKRENVLKNAGLQSELHHGKPPEVQNAVNATGKRPPNKRHRWRHSQEWR